MNKYKKAKEFIDMIWNEPSWSRVDIDWGAIEEIKELVDKETQMKPNITLNNAHCRTCSEPFGYARASHVNVGKWTAYCPVCGQKQDWRDEE